ncbi:MAG: alpha/beta fold hydrolase [Deltaproteobacteria bacterium]|nr:alpha/beta fold hydrolase [Deltaproteobacteria bacterium]
MRASLPFVSFASLAPVVFGLVVAACGSGESSPAPGGEPAPSAEGTTTAPPSGTSTSVPPASTTPPSSSDAGPDATTSTSRARCGAAPYNWVVSSALGDVLESQSTSSHTPVELAYAIYQANQQKAMKTNRLPKTGTKSRLVRYQTQDRGKLIDATTTITFPDVSDAKTFPILLVLHGTAGFTDACSPSKGVADDILGGFTDGQALLLSILASFGYIVVAPDYIGLKSIGAPTGFLHPYLVAEPTAIASLDAVRAARKLLATTNVTPGAVVTMGGSQGGHAAAFVNRYAPHYAPDISIKGAVWDVPPTDLIGHAQLALTTLRKATANTIAITTTFDSWYGSVPGGLASALKPPYLTTIPAALAGGCSPGDAFAGATLDTVFTSSFRTAGMAKFVGSPWRCFLEENSVATSSIPKLDSVPSLFLLGENDDLVDPAVERASFQNLCSLGYNLQYLECQGANHTRPLSWAFDQWIDFLEARLAGTPLTGACVVRPAEKCTSTP